MIVIDMRGIPEKMPIDDIALKIKSVVSEMLLLDLRDVSVSCKHKCQETEELVCIVDCWPGTFDRHYNQDVFPDSYIMHGTFESRRLQGDFTKKLASVLNNLLAPEKCRLLVRAFDHAHCTSA